MWRSLLSRDDGDLDPSKPSLFHPILEIGLGESEPPIPVEFPRAFETMLHEIEDHDLTPWFEDAMDALEGPGGRLGVVERLAEDDKVDRIGIDRRILEIAVSELEIGHPILLRLGGTVLDHLLRVVDGDHPSATQRQKLRKQTFAGTEVCNLERGQDPQQHVTECLPRTSRPIAPIEPSSDFIEVFLRLLRSTGDDPPEIDHVGRSFRKFLGSPYSHMDEFTILLGSWSDAVERPFAIPSGRDEAGLMEEAQVGRNAGLTKSCDLLELVDGQLLALEEGEQTETGWIRQSPQRLEGITHAGRLAHRDRFRRVPAAFSRAVERLVGPTGFEPVTKGL